MFPRKKWTQSIGSIRGTSGVIMKTSIGTLWTGTTGAMRSRKGSRSYTDSELPASGNDWWKNEAEVQPPSSITRAMSNWRIHYINAWMKTERFIYNGRLNHVNKTVQGSSEDSNVAIPIIQLSVLVWTNFQWTPSYP